MLHHYLFEIYRYIILFAIYSFLGWIVEILYRSATSKQFVNAGFLYGPLVPLYGIGALLLVFAHHLLHDVPFIIQILAYGLILTAMEYAVGVLTEKLFGITLWDYSENRYNLHGKACLSFSAAWTLLASLFIVFIHPAVTSLVRIIDKEIIRTSAMLLSVYLVIDFTLSVCTLKSFTRMVSSLFETISKDNFDTEIIRHPWKRLLGAFPDLNRFLFEKINTVLQNSVFSFVNTINRIKGKIDDRRPDEGEYNDIIKEILEHEEFEKLKNYRHHHTTTIYEHSKAVSYLSYKICKYLNLDFVSAGRGGLLHDFFQYDWRNHDIPELARNKFHGIEHPKVALQNAEKNFSVNAIERDIIIKHMWPLTPVPPRYRESFVVSFVDKYLASKELLNDLRN